MKRLAVLCVLTLMASTFPVLGQGKYGVTSTADKQTDFKKFKTYAWEAGWQANNPKVHTMIETAVDRELGALGLKKVTGPADVLVKYATLRKVDIELNPKPTSQTDVSRQIDVGTLLVLMLDPATRKELFRSRIDKPMELDLDKAESTINGAVTELFAKYPTRVTK